MSLVEWACSIGAWSWAKAVKIVWPFPELLSSFFRQSKVKFRNKRAGKLQQKNQIKVNLSYHNMSRDEILPDYVSCFSLHFFRAQTDCCVLRNRTEHREGFSIILIKSIKIHLCNFVHFQYIQADNCLHMIQWCWRSLHSRDNSGSLYTRPRLWDQR